MLSADFKSWKENEEKVTKSIYVKARGQAVRKNGDRVIQYQCCRSGIYRSRGHGKRMVKSECSMKIGTTCPAQIWAKVIDSQVFVRYRPKHENHDPAKEHLNNIVDESKLL